MGNPTPGSDPDPDPDPNPDPNQICPNVNLCIHVQKQGWDQTRRRAFHGQITCTWQIASQVAKHQRRNGSEHTRRMASSAAACSAAAFSNAATFAFLALLGFRRTRVSETVSSTLYRAACERRLRRFRMKGFGQVCSS